MKNNGWDLIVYVGDVGDNIYPLKVID